MKIGEINEIYYCTANSYKNNRCTLHDCCHDDKGTAMVDLEVTCVLKGCRHCLHKWPTPKQYQVEYGKKYSDKGAVYLKIYGDQCWRYDHYEFLKSVDEIIIVCACTPWGCPPDDWKPD